MYLLNLNRKGDIFKDDDGITGVPEFLTLIKKEKFGPTALKWVALVCDYESPYRHYNEKERVKAVSKDLYDTYSWSGVKDKDLKIASFKFSQATILLSRGENFGVTVTESLSLGKIPLITNKVGISREIKKFNAGIICGDNISSISNMIEMTSFPFSSNSL